VPRICLELCALFSNKSQHLLLYFSLENVPSITLEICANFSNKSQHLLLYFSLEKRAQKLPRNLCKLSNKYQHLLLYLPLENVPKNCLEICAKTCPETASKSVQTQQYGPALMVVVPFLGFRALDSLEIVPFMHLPLLSSLQAAPWNSSLFKLFSLECVPKK